MGVETDRFRHQFPVLQQMLFLNHASESPVSLPVRRRIEEYLTGAALDPDAVPMRVDLLKEQLARLLGGHTDEYALMPNTGTGIGTVAGGLCWQPGDNVVLPAEEYPANQYPWLNLRDRGVEVRIVPLEQDLSVDPERVAASVDDRTRVLAVSAVEYLSGFRNHLKRLSAIAHAHGALFVVDGIQAAGVLPINVEDDGIDVLAAGGYKWLLGPIGTGFTYFRRSVWSQIRTILPGARSSVEGPGDSAGRFTLLQTAQRYETGCMPFSLINGWTAGLEMLLEAGTENIYGHLISLTGQLIDGLQARGFTVLSPVSDPAHRSGIVCFTAGSPQANEALVERLRTQAIIIAYRGGRCRVSPHFYNSPADINRFLEALA